MAPGSVLSSSWELTCLINTEERHWIINGHIIQRLSMQTNQKGNNHFDFMGRLDRLGHRGVWEECSRNRPRQTGARVGASLLKDTYLHFGGLAPQMHSVHGAPVYENVRMKLQNQGFIPD